MTETVVARQMHRTLEPYHGFVYFAPEAHEAYTAIGITDRRMGYFASRSAAMGSVSAEVVVATFFNFAPALVHRSIPAAWSLASPARVLRARLDGVDAALKRILGDEVASPGVAEAAELARRAVATCRPEGRPLFAAHAALEWPEAPHLRLWLATSPAERAGQTHTPVMHRDRGWRME